MEITFACPHCGATTLIDESFVGQSGPCRRCDAIITISKQVTSENPFTESKPVRDESPSTFWHAFSHPAQDSRDDDVEIMTAPLSTRVRILCFIGVVALLVVLANWLLLPKVGSQGPSKHMITQNGLKQIILALQNYQSDHRQLPPAFYRSAEGEIILPWRAAILPYVEEEPLYDRYAKNEPWDSPNNYSVTATSVAAFRHPDLGDDRDGQTGYVAVTGPGSLFVEGERKRLEDGKLPTEEMIVLVEIPESDVHWSEPVDVDLFVQFFRARQSQPHERRFSWREGASVAFADGSIRRLTAMELEAKLQAMFASARPEDVATRFAVIED